MDFGHHCLFSLELMIGGNRHQSSALKSNQNSWIMKNIAEIFPWSNFVPLANKRGSVKRVGQTLHGELYTSNYFSAHPASLICQSTHLRPPFGRSGQVAFSRVSMRASVSGSASLLRLASLTTLCIILFSIINADAEIVGCAYSPAKSHFPQPNLSRCQCWWRIASILD
jgi:hypothetical protein